MPFTLDLENKLQADKPLLRLSKISLNFSDKNIEKQFRLEYFKKSLYAFRVAFITLIILYGAFGYLDVITSAKYFKEFFIIRYVIVIPMLIGMYIFSYHKYFAYAWQELISFCFLIGGAGIIYMLLRNPYNIFYYGGLFLVFMAGYFFVKLRFFYAIIPGFLLVILYNAGGELFKNYFEIKYTYLLATNAFYISANIIGAIALYYIERLERIDFFQKLMLSEKQNEIELINQNLENEVAERTKLLDDRNKALIEEIQYRKEIEKQHFLAKEKAEESDRLKSAFLANMSHEIRTPMNGILGFANLLKKPKLTGEEQEKYIDIIKSSGARLLNIINDLIDISKVESGQMEVTLSRTNLNEQLDYIYSFFKPEVESKGLQFLMKKTLPVKEMMVNTDREKVFAILTNLVKNAVKYTDVGTIELGYHKNGKFIEFYVKDTGIGIDKRSHGIIFERFRQDSELLTSNYEGAGLGLSITKAYVEMLGGTIRLESEKGKGSAFYFTIPYSTETAQENKNNLTTIDDDNEKHLKKAKILIAEDDEASELLISYIVQKFSSEILKAVKGSEAVEIVRNHPDIKLVLMDIKMPEMDGYEATRQIRKFNKEVIIIAQTAFGLTHDREKAIEAGCTDYISKPIDQNVLSMMIKKYL